MVCASAGTSLKVTALMVEKKAVCSYLAVVLKIALIDNKEWKIVFNGTECTACRNCWGRFGGLCHSGGQPR